MPSCPLCKSDAKQLYKINYYHYFCCSNCKTLFLHPKPTERAVNQYYKTLFGYSTGKVEECRIRERARIIIAQLRKFNPQGKTLMDIGSGYGYFLDEANKLNLEVTGIEPSKKLHSISINQLIDINIIFSSFEQYFKKKQKEKFDFITLIHVIEHVSNPEDFIRMASKMLNKNGILYIETPNYNSWLAKTEKENYTFLTPPDHIWIFSKFSMIRIIEKIKQLNILRISTYSYPEHFMGIMKRKFQNPISPSTPSSGPRGNFQTNSKYQISNDKQMAYLPLKKLKYYFFDRLIAPIFTPLLNIGGYGSILELYIKKIK